MNYLSQSWLINRRHALRALGTCISLPMLECMIPLRAEEQSAAPRRSAFIYLANGVHSLNYQITTAGRDYKFSRSLKPLEKHREVTTAHFQLCSRPANTDAHMSNLLLLMAQRMGVETEKFGDSNSVLEV